MTRSLHEHLSSYAKCNAPLDLRHVEGSRYTFSSNKVLRIMVLSLFSTARFDNGKVLDSETSRLETLGW